jgi:hypothetical protein
MATRTPQAAPVPKPNLTFSILDPVGDQMGAIDVTGMKMTWNPANGQYAIELTADTAHPFTGQFRVSINVFNPGSTSSSKLFGDHCSQCYKFGGGNKSDWDLGSATTTTLTWKGGDPELKFWKADSQVATTTAAGLGNPPGIALFRSSVDTQPIPGSPLTHEDVIGYDDPTAGTDGTAAAFINGNGSYGLATIVAAP